MVAVERYTLGYIFRRKGYEISQGIN